MKTQAEVLRELISFLDKHQLPYLIGGSVASSALGVPRSTLDTDLLVKISAGAVLDLANDLGNEWYFDPEFALLAIKQQRAFNLIHIPSGYKFNVFPAHSAFHKSELQRAAIRQLGVPGDQISCMVATAEDMLLAKLRWYLDGGKTSERQWADIIGILKLNDLDLSYVSSWARELAVVELLESARQASAEN